MKNHHINHDIPKSAEGTYYTIPFPVPEGLERVTVSYKYPKVAARKGKGPISETLSVVDLGLMDGEGRFLGWSGGARDSVFVGPYASTKGYHMTPLTPGEWKIIVGAYRIPTAGLRVQYDISYTPKGPRWFSGDLHMHSDASDGQHDIPTLTRMAREAGLDFIAVANHNNFSENLNLPVVPGLTLLPAVEWTHYKGHMNFFGAKAPFDNSFIANSEDEMRGLIAEARKKGALISANHPKCSLCPYLWESDDFDLIEVWNGPMRPANLRNIAWWHEMLLAGRRLPIVAGSDFHRDRHPVRFGHPITRVYANSPAAEDILAGIAGGHSYLTSSAKGPALDLRCGDAGLGDSLPMQQGLTLTVSAQHLRPGVKLRLVTSEGTAAKWSRHPGGKITAEVAVQPAWRFAYLVAERRVFGMDLVRGITNPVFFD